MTLCHTNEGEEHVRKEANERALVSRSTARSTLRLRKCKHVVHRWLSSEIQDTMTSRIPKVFSPHKTSDKTSKTLVKMAEQPANPVLSSLLLGSLQNFQSNAPDVSGVCCLSSPIEKFSLQLATFVSLLYFDQFPIMSQTLLRKLSHGSKLMSSYLVIRYPNVMNGIAY